MHRAAKVDANQTAITDALRKMGATVQHLFQLGAGCPDILAGYKGVNILVEIKDGSKPPSKRKLTPDEAAWHEQWRGQVSVVESVDDAVALLNRVTGYHPRSAGVLRRVIVPELCPAGRGGKGAK